MDWQRIRGVKYLLASGGTILIFGIIAYQLKLYHLRKEKKPKITVLEFLNNGKLPDWPDILAGLSFGVVFGFLDVFLIFYGIDYLNVLMPGGLLTKAGLGNIYSDFMGATMGTFISYILKDFTDFLDEKEPIWIKTVGLLIGCILGLVAARLLTGKK